MESFLVHNLESASCNLGRRHAPTGFWSLSLKEAIQVIKSAVPQIDAAMWGEIRRSKSLSPFEIKDDSQGLRTERLYRAEVVLQILRLSRTKLEDRVEAALKEKLVALHAVAQPADPVVGSHTPQSNQQGCAESELSCPRADLQVFTLEHSGRLAVPPEAWYISNSKGNNGFRTVWVGLAASFSARGHQ